jgi:small basic protein
MTQIMDNRIIQAGYFAIAGLFLGIIVAITWSLYINSSTSSVLIILMTTTLYSLLGFVFPNSIQHGFKLFWNLFL